MFKVFTRATLALILVLSFLLPIVVATPVFAVADNHWTNVDGGNWSTAGNWSLGHAPDATENALFDCAFNVGKTVTVDATANCLNMNCTGATNTPTLAMGNNIINVYGNCTFIAAMAQTSSAGGTLQMSGTGTLTTNTLSLASNVIVNGNITVQLADTLTTSRDFIVSGAATSPTFISNNNTMNVRTFQITGSGIGTKTITLGTSTINIASNVAVGWEYSGSNLTLTANTATINIAGTGNFVGGGITTYNIVNLNGSAHTISGSNTFANLNFTGAGSAITITTGTTQTVTGTLNLGSATVNCTDWLTVATNLTAGTSLIKLSNAGVAARTFNGGNLTYNNVTINGAGNYATTITGNNTFNTFTVDRSLAAKTVTVTAGTTQTIASLVSATNGVVVTTINSTGAAATFAKSGGGRINLNYLNLSNNTGSPAYTWHYGLNSTIGAGVTNWSTGEPVLTTQAASSVEETTATLNGTLVDVGADATVRGFQYDTDSGAPYVNDIHSNGAFGETAFTEGPVGLTKGELYYFRSYATNPLGTGYGAEVTFLTKPDEPTGLTAVGALHQATLTWTKGTGALNTYIRYKTTGYPANTADGTLGYNGIGTNTTVLGLTGDTTYYFRAWSYATEGGLSQYSDLFSSANDVVFDTPDVTTNVATDVSMTSLGTTATMNGNLTDMGGALAITVWFEWGPTPAYGFTSTSQVLAAIGTYSVTVTNFQPGTTYYYRAVAENLEGPLDGYGTSQSFGATPSAVYSIISLLPYLFVALAVLAVWGMVNSGIGLAEMAVLAAVLAIVGIIGAEMIARVLSTLW